MDRKKRLDKFILTAAKAEQYKKEYEALKKDQDEKETLKKKQEELKDYKTKLGEIKYGKYKTFLKKHWKITAKVIAVLIVIWIILYIKPFIWQ